MFTFLGFAICGPDCTKFATNRNNLHKATKHDKKMAQREKEGEDNEKDTYGMDRKAKYRLELREREQTAKSAKRLNSELEKAEKEAMVDTVLGFGIV